MASLKRADANLYYRLFGNASGIPVLLIHGIGVVGGAWRPQISALEKEFQTLNFDNRGIGQSVPSTGPVSIQAMADDARALLDAVHWDSAHVVGHSMGGTIAQQLTLDCPKRIRSLSLLCTFDRGKNGARITPWVLWMAWRTRVGSRRMRRRAFLEMLIPKDDMVSIDCDSVASQFASLIGRDLAHQPRILLEQLGALARHDCSGRLGELAAIPTLVVSAQHDKIALAKYGRTLASLIPNARFEELAAASHGVTIYNPEKLNRMLRQFLLDSESAK